LWLYHRLHDGLHDWLLRTKRFKHLADLIELLFLFQFGFISKIYQVSKGGLLILWVQRWLQADKAFHRQHFFFLF
jgi:hypothetical protein